MASPLPKRSKVADENVNNVAEKVTTQAKDTKEVSNITHEDLPKWFENASSHQILDRWFKCTSNFSGGRFNFVGDFIGEFDGKTDWHDFEKCLDQVPALATLTEWGIPIIRHVCHAKNPPVPASTMKKLIQVNPSILQDRYNQVADPMANNEDEEPYRGNVNVLILYQYAPSFVIDSWDPTIDVCKVLIEAEPKLLFYHDDHGECAKDDFLFKYKEQGEEFLEELGKRVDLEALEKEVQAEEEKEAQDKEEDWELKAVPFIDWVWAEVYATISS